MKHTTQRTQGFTLVELATIIFIIGILVAITIGTYNSVQARARDSSRISDMKNIGKALEIHKSREGAFPPRESLATSWAYSNEYPTTYITGLAGQGKPLNSLPKDPTNNATYRYAYYVYSAGSQGCDANLGRFYVLVIPRMETVAAGSRHKDSPGFVCPLFDWSTGWGGAAWVQGGFVNG